MTNSFSRLLRSTAILIIPTLALFNLISWYAVEYTDLRIDILGPSERLIVLRKLEEWSKPAQVAAQKASNTEPVVFISSSLGISAANLADHKKYGQPELKIENYLAYDKYRSLDDAIAKHTGKKTSTINFSNAASLVSEDLLIAREAVRLRGKPAVIVLGIAPRDFLDHYTNAYHRSRLAQILMARQVTDLWRFNKTAQENLDTNMAKIWPYYSQRVEHKDLAIKLACQRLNRSADLFSAVSRAPAGDNQLSPIAPAEASTSKEKTAPPAGNGIIEILFGKKKESASDAGVGTIRDTPPTEEILKKFDSDYRGRYLPLDMDRWTLEIKSLREFVEFANEKKIPLLIVGMPLSPRNRELIPAQFLQKHLKEVEEITTNQPYVRFINLLEDPQFLAEDYSDTVHLRSSGSLKLVEMIGADLKNSGWFD